MVDYQKIIDRLNALETEQVNPRTVDIDLLPPLEAVRRINDEDKTVAMVVERALPEIAAAAELFAASLRADGRVFYVGAGTSGRLGVLDAVECPPTFGTDPQQIIGLISGGYDTLVMSQEGVEDRCDSAISDLEQQRLSPGDLVIGLAASRRTPYTLSALEYAQSIGCKTVFIICNSLDQDGKADPVIDNVSVLVSLPVGPEVITGSTRMKSGTAQKMTLNMISTTAMVILGKTYGNLMVDLQAKSDKLAARSRKLLMDILAIDLQQADDLLARADGIVKTAILMQRASINKPTAEAILEKHSGHLKAALENGNNK